MAFLYQCCYTNLLRYDGPYKVGGWTTTAFSRDIPPEALRACEQFQRADASDRATDEFGRALRLYEFIASGSYAYVIRTRYGMRDHMGRGNNLFSHAYIFPMDGGFLERPEAAFCLDAGCFEQDAGAGTPPDMESAELARRAAERLRGGVLEALTPQYVFDFARALDATRLSLARESYKTLLECVYVQMDEKREAGRPVPPLYIQYGSPDASAQEKDRELRELLCCIMCGLPHAMRRTLTASNWSDISNTPKDLIFTTEDVTRLAGADGHYLIVRTGAHNLERRRVARMERSGYLPYAAMELEPEYFPVFFTGLERYAKALGDEDASGEAVRRIVWRCYWDSQKRAFTERPHLDGLERKDLISLLSDAANSGRYGMGLKELVDGVKKRVPPEALTESLRRNLERWEKEYRQRHEGRNIPEKPSAGHPALSGASTVTGGTFPASTPTSGGTFPASMATNGGAFPTTDNGGASAVNDGNTSLTVSAGASLTVTDNTSFPAVMDDVSFDAFSAMPDGGASGTLLPVKNWNAVERDWLAMPDDRRNAILDWLSQLLNRCPTVPIAVGLFTRQTEHQPQKNTDTYLFLMMERKASGKLNPRAVVRAYWLERLTQAQGKPDAVRWIVLSDACSVCQRMGAADLEQRVKEDAWELFRKEGVPGTADGRAVKALRMYLELMGRLYPPDSGGAETFETLKRAACGSYWEQADGNWKYFSFDALDEYDAFDDGRRHVFPMFIRLARSFRPKKEREFLKQVCRFFAVAETPGYYTNENKLRVTSLLYDELQRTWADEMSADYQAWMNLATVAEDKGAIPAIQELYDALHPFDVWKVTTAYPRFIWKCRDGGDRKVRELAYPVIEQSCFDHDSAQAVPLDLWITIGIEALSFYALYNCFAIFEKKPDAAVLRMDAAEVVRDSSMMGSPAVQDYAQAYIRYRGDAQIRKVVQNWLNEVSGGRKKFLGVF